MSGFELILCEQVLMDEIADERTTRDDLALTYALSLVSSECGSIHWETVNEAIVRRWSVSALEYIKREAWKLVEERRGG